MTEVSHRHEGRNQARVVLHTDDGRREFIVSGDQPGYTVTVEAAVAAYTSGSPISVYATREGLRAFSRRS